MRTLFALGLLTLAVSVQAQPADLSVRIDAIAQRALADGSIAGLSVAIVQGGEVLHARGYGLADIEAGTAVTTETLFNVASVGKIIAAVAVLKLVDEGRLSLDDDLATLLPAFPNPEQGRRITLRQLLNHTSGLSDYVPADLERWKQTREPLDPSFVLDYVRDRPLDFEPGTDYSYSNTGFYLAGMIVERVSGRSWGDYVLGEVAAPLGLHSVVLCDEAGARRTTVYDRTDAGLVPSVVGAEQGIRGDGGLCMNVRDLARLPHALRTSGVLSESSLAEMLHPTVLADGLVVDYGLGVARGVLHGHPLWGHLGGAEGSLAATLIHYPDDDATIAVVVNTRFGDVGPLLLEGYIAPLVLGLEEPLLPRTSLAAGDLARYAGTYAGGRTQRRYRFRPDGTQLLRESPSGRTATLHHVGDHTFGWEAYPLDRFAFHISDGQARAYSLYLNGLFVGLYRRTDR